MEKIRVDTVVELVYADEFNDKNLRGFFTDANNQVWFDRRFTFEAMQAASAAMLYFAVGPSFIAVSNELASKFGYNGA